MKAIDFYLIRGLSREADHWGDFTDNLKGKNFVGKVIPLDFPGVGSFYNLTSPLRVSEYADFLLSQMDENNKREKVILSISLGSMVAVEMARKRKNFFHRIYLMNTSFSGLSPFYHRLQWKSFKEFFSIVMASGIKKREWNILRLVSNRPSLWPLMIDSFVETARKRPCKTGNVLRQLWAAFRYSVDPGPPEGTSFVVLNSRGDRMVDPRCSETLAKHWGVPLHTHPRAGHDLPLDAPEWILDIVSGEYADTHRL